MTEGLAEVWALQVLAEINPDQGYSLPREHFLKFVWSLRLAQSRNSEPNAPQAKFTHHTHTHTHIPLNTLATPYPGKITICQHVHGLSLQRCREALVCGKPDTFLAFLSAPRWPAAPPGNEALQGPAAAWHEWGAAAPHWGKRQGHPALPQHTALRPGSRLWLPARSDALQANAGFGS